MRESDFPLSELVFRFFTETSQRKCACQRTAAIFGLLPGSAGSFPGVFVWPLRTCASIGYAETPVGHGTARVPRRRFKRVCVAGYQVQKNG